MVTAGRPSPVLCLEGVVGGDGALLLPDQSARLQELLEDVEEEARRYGPVLSVVCPQVEDGGDAETLAVFGERWRAFDEKIRAGNLQQCCPKYPSLGDDLAPGLGCVFVAFEMEADARAALLGMRGKRFDGRVIDAVFHPTNQDVPSQRVQVMALAPECDEGDSDTATAGLDSPCAQPAREILTASGAVLQSIIIKNFSSKLNDAQQKAIRSVGYDI